MLGPALRDDMVAGAAHNQRRELEFGQAVRDVIREHVAHSLDEFLEAGLEKVQEADGDQR